MVEPRFYHTLLDLGRHKDDGDPAELVISIDPGESMVWMNTFPVDPGGAYIDAIRVAYGRVGSPSALNGLPVTILLYEDTNGGSPQDAVLKWSTTTTIANRGGKRSARWRLTKSHECEDWLPPCRSSTSCAPGSPHSVK